jgi:N-acetylglucosamine kinase-like BadF-type ATPase
MHYFLAIDAGGTKTDYVLADEVRELARVRTGTIKRMRIDEDAAAHNLDAALAQLSAATAVSMHAIRRTCIGTAGQSVPLVADWLREAIGDRVGGDLMLLGDVEIALDAAFPGAPGVLVLAGTGSNVAGRTPAGGITTAGGWGPALSDQGSGYRIGFEALRAIFLAHDEGRKTLLMPAILDLWKLHTIDNLVARANAVPAPDFSRLTSIVLACARQGDEVAAAVLHRQGKELGHLARLVIRRLKLASNEPDWTPPVAFAGSIMEMVEPVRDTVIASIQAEFPTVQTLEGVVDPLAGALWRARKGYR